MNAIITGLVATLVGAAAMPAAAQDRPLTDLSLAELLKVEVVSAASKFSQEVREAPAAITVVTADDIRRLGHRTLADVLRGVRGLYTTYDRNYAYLGVRGFARPGDYNTRVLLLVDGHRLNDAVYDMAPIGTDFPVDISLIDRVEVIRGPGSSLYGTSAFFAVINVVTRGGAQHAGVRAEVSGGSLESAGASASYGRRWSNGREFLIGGSAYRSGGAGRLFFPELGPDPVVGLDDDNAQSGFLSMAVGRVSVRAGAGRRFKRVPTASFDTVVGDDRLTTTDQRAYISAVYDGAFGRGWTGSGRVAYDRYDYDGGYPFDDGAGQSYVERDQASSQTVSGELMVRRRVGGAHLVSAGVEVRNQFRARMWAANNIGTTLDVNRPATQVGVYLQDELRLRNWLLLNAGARLDRHDAFGVHVAPRAGLVLLPRPATAIKLLHGRAFRAPNPYELYYYAPMRDERFDLEPEEIHSTELVWEESLSRRVRTSVSVFGYDVSALIEQGTVPTPAGDELIFRNTGDVDALGVEGEVEARIGPRALVRLSHTAVRTRNDAGERISNSPAHLTKGSLQVPLAPVTVGVEALHRGERRTLAGDPLAGFAIANLTLTSPVHDHVEWQVGVYNVFGTRYQDPGADEHRQGAIPQDTRTVLARVRLRF